MSSDLESHTIRLLQEMRAENAVQYAEIRSRIGVIAKGQIDIRSELREVRTELKDVRTELSRLTTHVHEIAIAVDHHTTRLDAIERHLGLDTSQH
jgi:hypothetical protein